MPPLRGTPKGEKKDAPTPAARAPTPAAQVANRPYQAEWEALHQVTRGTGLDNAGFASLVSTWAADELGVDAVKLMDMMIDMTVVLEDYALVVRFLFASVRQKVHNVDVGHFRIFAEAFTRTYLEKS